ncbi:MAG: ABC transporter ATP-binding protein [bacterium]|nr:ABC transporter ATP-binding protein [bacterium]
MSSHAACGAREGEPEALLQVRDLAVHYVGAGGEEAAVLEEASFDLAVGETLGVLGESGGGKSTLALAVLGLLPPNGRVTAGRVSFHGRDLLRLSRRDLDQVRGDEASMIFQEPGVSLNPCMRAGDQVADVARVHRRWPAKRCREEARAMLELVGFDDSDGVFGAYPHQLSGGQKQRVVIAQALVCRPALLIADEPTASLDATTQAEIVALLRDLRQRLGLAMLFVSHDVALLHSLVDRMIVMYAGQIVESGSRDQVVLKPSHPYTRELLRCVPGGAEKGVGPGRPRLPTILGSPPDPARWPPGCRFEPRCPDRLESCGARRPEPRPAGDAGTVRCLLYDD